MQSTVKYHHSDVCLCGNIGVCISDKLQAGSSSGSGLERLILKTSSIARFWCLVYDRLWSIGRYNPNACSGLSSLTYRHPPTSIISQSLKAKGAFIMHREKPQFPTKIQPCFIYIDVCINWCLHIVVLYFEDCLNPISSRGLTCWTRMSGDVGSLLCVKIELWSIGAPNTIGALDTIGPLEQFRAN